MQRESTAAANIDVYGPLNYDGRSNVSASRARRVLAVAMAAELRRRKWLGWLAVGQVMDMLRSMPESAAYTDEELKSNAGKAITEHRTIFTRRDSGSHAGFVRLHVLSGGEPDADNDRDGLNNRRAAALASGTPFI